VHVIVSTDNVLGKPSSLVGFALPRIASIAGCDNNADPLRPAECDRRGGSWLVFTGTNFGPAGALVLVHSQDW
jgi:hypothetical protein